MDKLTLDGARNNLQVLEDIIISSFFRRMQYKTNDEIYEKKEILVPIFDLPILRLIFKKKIYYSFLELYLQRRENLDAYFGRYADPRECPFCIKIREPIIPRRKYNLIDMGPEINVNKRIMDVYPDWISSICEEGDDNEWGSAASADITLLQLLSERIYGGGKQVAEAKFQENSYKYRSLILEENEEGLMKEIKNEKAERDVLDRVWKKGRRYNVNPEFVSRIYEEEVIPLTIEVELQYLKSKRNSI